MKALLLALLLPLLAAAQPLTLDSPCGAPGVGIRSVDKAVIREEVGRPGWHVDADGTWTTCQLAKPTRKGCRVDQAIEWKRFDESVQCRAPATGQRVADGQPITLFAQPPTGEFIEGRVVLRCQNRALQVESSTCNRVTVCDRKPGSRSSDDGGDSGTWWYFTGLLFDGERGLARSEGGRVRAVQCNGGRLDLL